MEKLIELSNKIEDKKLRKLVVDFLKDPTPSNEHFKKYPKADIETAITPFSMSGMGSVERDVLNHTIALVESCEKISDVLEKTHGLPLNRDILIASAIVHDIMKLFEWRKGPQGVEHTGVMLDHTMFATSELYSRGFPEEVVHIVAAHFGESGPTPPRSFEALLLSQIDSVLAGIEFRMLAPDAQAQQAVQMIFLDDETMKKMGELSGIEEEAVEGSEKS